MVLSDRLTYSTHELLQGIIELEVDLRRPTADRSKRTNFGTLLKAAVRATAAKAHFVRIADLGTGCSEGLVRVGMACRRDSGKPELRVALAWHPTP